jgi:hypothetical protein
MAESINRLVKEELDRWPVRIIKRTLAHLAHLAMFNHDGARRLNAQPSVACCAVLGRPT